MLQCVRYGTDLLPIQMPFKRTNQTGGCEHDSFGLQRSVQYAQIFLFQDPRIFEPDAGCGGNTEFFFKKRGGTNAWGDGYS